MTMVETEADIDWGYLDAFVEDYFPKSTWGEKSDLGFEQIAATEVKIVHLKERLTSQRLRASKRIKIECQLAGLESNITRLKAGHEEAAKVLRRKALVLAALPREMRDAIFEQIYVENLPVEVAWSRLGNSLVFEMPKDTALYMSSLHVGPELAQEAAEIFYKRNTFTFVRNIGKRAWRYNLRFAHWGQAQIDGWFLRDHYGSGVVPKDFIRKLEVGMNPPAYYFNDAILYNWQNDNYTKVCNHINLEDIWDTVSQDWQDYRLRLRVFLKYDSLQHIRVTLPPLGNRFDIVARILNPVVRELRAAGLKVAFEQHSYEENDQVLDLSAIFDAPSDGDYAEYYQTTQRKSVFTDEPERNMFDTWKIIDAGAHAVSGTGNGMVDAYTPETAKVGFMRVWMCEHYEIHKFMKRDRKRFRVVQEMVEEFRSLTIEERELRRRVYPNIMDHFR